MHENISVPWQKHVKITTLAMDAGAQNKNLDPHQWITALLQDPFFCP